MSSPMENLKKGKRSPFNGHTVPSNVPYRYGNDPLLEEVTSNIAKQKLGQTVNQSRHHSSTPAPTDLDLMQTMVARIAVLEKQNQIQAKQLLEKDKRINVLEEKVSLYQKLNDEQTHSPNYVRNVEAKCMLLQEQISEMEEFLMDYGMIWVGEREETDDEILLSHRENWEPQTSLVSNCYKIEYDHILENVKELNQLAGDGETKIEKTALGAKFTTPDTVQLVLYSNGIMLFDGPFRPIEDESTQQCVQDLIDGYFPTELQSKYPDGVPFKVVDKRNVAFRKTDKAFSGVGQSVGGSNQPSRLIPSVVNSDRPNEDVETSMHGVKMTANQFLSKLPNSVVKNGKVIDIRKSLEENLTDSQTCPVTVVQTDTMQELKDRLNLDENLRPPSGKNITTLRIKDWDNHTYVLKMRYTDTIADVKNYINNQRRNQECYTLVTTFPNKSYDDLEQNLFSAGLTPNATMHIRVRK